MIQTSFQKMVLGFVPADDDCFENWFKCFEVIINTIFPLTRAIRVIKKQKVLRPTLEEQKIHCSKMLKRMFPEKYEEIILPSLEMIYPIPKCQCRLNARLGLFCTTIRCTEKFLKFF